MKDKKGQLTIFIIIAIIIVAIIISFFLIKNSKSLGKTGNFGNDVNVYIQDCLKSSSEETIMNIGLRGGYYEIQEYSTQLGFTYYYDKNNNFHFPTLKVLENETSFYIEKELINCIGNFSNFKNYDLINYTKIATSSTIYEDQVKIEVIFPIIISKGEEKVTIEKFVYNIPVRLGLIYNATKNILKKTPNSKGVCLNCIYFESVENDIKINLFDEEELITIFIIEDEYFEVNENKFKFIFANYYPEENDI
jgi:hypothetical protein